MVLDDDDNTVAKKQSTFIDLDTKDRDNLLDSASNKNWPLQSPCSAGRKLETFLGSISNASEVLVQFILGH